MASRASRNNRSNQLNPNSTAYASSRSSTVAANNNRSNQLNPNHSSYLSARQHPPADITASAWGGVSTLVGSAAAAGPTGGAGFTGDEAVLDWGIVEDWSRPSHVAPGYVHPPLPTDALMAAVIQHGGGLSRPLQQTVEAELLAEDGTRRSVSFALVTSDSGLDKDERLAGAAEAAVEKLSLEQEPRVVLSAWRAGRASCAVAHSSFARDLATRAKWEAEFKRIARGYRFHQQALTARTRYLELVAQAATILQAATGAEFDSWRKCFASIEVVTADDFAAVADALLKVGHLDERYPSIEDAAMLERRWRVLSRMSARLAPPLPADTLERPYSKYFDRFEAAYTNLRWLGNRSGPQPLVGQKGPLLGFAQFAVYWCEFLAPHLDAWAIDAGSVTRENLGYRFVTQAKLPSAGVTWKPRLRDTA